MEARELRIGNYYMFADYDGIVRRAVKEIKANEFGLIGDYDGVNFGICQPIQLTEEWLLKFGFEFNEFHKNYKVKVDYYHHSIKFYKNEWVYSNDISDASCHTITSIQYVHQLQNLYFSLTGEELTIKNNAQ